MSRVNLLPPEFRKRRANLRLTRRIRFAGVCAVLLLGGLYGLRTYNVMELRSELDDIRAEQVSVQSQIDGLADVSQAQAAVEASRQIVADLMRGEIAWSQQLLHLSTAVPNEFVVTGVSGSAVGDPSQMFVGSLTFSASSKGFVPTQSWIQRLQGQDGWANPWVSSAQGVPETTVSGTVDLTQQALTTRGGGSS